MNCKHRYNLSANYRLVVVFKYRITLTLYDSTYVLNINYFIVFNFYFNLFAYV